MRIVKSTVLAAGDMSQASLTSSEVNLEHLEMASVQASWAGTSPVGTLKLQFSNDCVVWTDYATTVAVSGNSGNAMLQLADIGYARLRAVYTKTSGTGTLKIVVNAKGVA